MEFRFGKIQNSTGICCISDIYLFLQVARVKSRIDFFLVAKNLTQYGKKKVGVRSSVAPDHNGQGNSPGTGLLEV